MPKIDLKSRDRVAAEEEAKRKQAWLRVHGPGPPIIRCDECGAPAMYGLHDYSSGARPIDALDPEHYCERHAPDSLKRPGDH